MSYIAYIGKNSLSNFVALKATDNHDVTEYFPSVLHDQTRKPTSLNPIKKIELGVFFNNNFITFITYDLTAPANNPNTVNMQTGGGATFYFIHSPDSNLVVIMDDQVGPLDFPSGATIL